MVISRISLVNTLARLASSAFLRPSMDGPLPMCVSRRYRTDRGGILAELGREVSFVVGRALRGARAWSRTPSALGRGRWFGARAFWQDQPSAPTLAAQT